MISPTFLLAIPLVVKTEPRAPVSVVAEDETRVAVCASVCTLQLPAGRYRLELDGESVPSKTQALRLDRSTVVTATPGSSTAHGVGLALGIAGIPLAIGGALGLASNSCFGDDCSARYDSRAATVWGIVGAAGVAMEIGGWITFGVTASRLRVERAEPTVSFTGRGVELRWGF